MNRTTLARVLSLLAFATAPAIAACSSASAPDEPGGTGASAETTGASSSSSSTSSSSGSSIAAVTACDDDDIKDDFTGPGYDAQKGGLQPPLQASYVAATTVLLMSSDPAKQMLFTQLAGPVIGQVATQPGLVGYQIAISAKCHYARTLTVWKDMDSMMEFVASPNHAKAMENGSQVASAAAVTEWTIQASDMPPTWALARTQIAGMGQPAY